MRRSHTLVWSLLGLCALSPIASFVHMLHEQHSVCAEHPGAAHHEGDVIHGEALAALNTLPQRFADPANRSRHEHCGIMGTFDRACEKQPGTAPVKPTLRQDETPVLPRPRALPPVIYAYAPKTSPPTFA